MQENTTPYNNQQNTSNDDKTNGHAKNQQPNTASDLHPACLFRGRTEWRRKNLFQMVDSRNGLFLTMPTLPSPPPSTPVIMGLLDVKLHPRKSAINPSSLSGFHPTPLVVVSPSIILLQQLVVLFSLDILSLRPFLVVLSPWLLVPLPLVILLLRHL
jgi:hypothetical protein